MTRQKIAVRSERRLILAPWEEVVGRLEGLDESNDTLRVKLSFGILQYDVASGESEVLRAKLIGREGSVVGILRTDSGIRVRIDEGEKHETNPKI